MTTKKDPPMPPQKFAEGTGRGTSADTACVRALDSYMKLAEKADLVMTELDNLTAPGVLHNKRLPEDDSLVIAIHDFVDNET